MHFAALAAAIVPFVALSSAAPALAKRDVGIVTFCTGANTTGLCTTRTFPVNECVILPDDYYGHIKTFVPDHGNLVRLTNSADSCTRHGDVFLQWPGSHQLDHYKGGNYSNATSFLIQPCSSCA